jgi:hypothetical protein
MADTRRCAVLASARKVRDLTFERKIAFLGVLACLTALIGPESARRAKRIGKSGQRMLVFGVAFQFWRFVRGLR